VPCSLARTAAIVSRAIRSASVSRGGTIPRGWPAPAAGTASNATPASSAMAMSDRTCTGPSSFARHTGRTWRPSHIPRRDAYTSNDSLHR
jgi:hypothetical protein